MFYTVLPVITYWFICSILTYYKFDPIETIYNNKNQVTLYETIQRVFILHLLQIIFTLPLEYRYPINELRWYYILGGILILDTVEYWIHRFWHSNPYLYKYIHKNYIKFLLHN